LLLNRSQCFVSYSRSARFTRFEQDNDTTFLLVDARESVTRNLSRFVTVTESVEAND
jgi:hypothetical protein